MDVCIQEVPPETLTWQDFAPGGEVAISDKLKESLWAECPDEFKEKGNDWRQYAEFFYSHPSSIRHWPFKVGIEVDQAKGTLIKLLTRVGWRSEHRYPVLGWWLSLVLESPPEIPHHYRWLPSK